MPCTIITPEDNTLRNYLLCGGLVKEQHTSYDEKLSVDQNCTLDGFSINNGIMLDSRDHDNATLCKMLCDESPECYIWSTDSRKNPTCFIYTINPVFRVTLEAISGYTTGTMFFNNP